ncbi:hypothetical protein D3C78_1172140 [compost metagenome]
MQCISECRVSGYIIDNFTRSVRYPARGGFKVSVTRYDPQIVESHRLHRARGGANILCSCWGNQHYRQVHLCSLINQLAGESVIHLNILRGTNLQNCNTNHRNNVSL